MIRKTFLLFLLALSVSISILAQNTEIKKLEEQRKQTLREISNTDQLLQKTKKNTSSLLSRIAMINNKILGRQKVLDLLNKEVEGIEKQQKNIEREIVQLEIDLVKRKRDYATAIDGMLANRQNQSKMLFVLSGKSISESYRRFHYLKDYSEWRSQQAEEVKEKSNELKEKESDLAKTKYEKEALLRQRGRERENLKREEQSFQKEATEGQKKQNELQKQLNQKKKQAEGLNKEIGKLIASEVAKQEQKAKQQAKQQAKKATSPPSGKKPPTSPAAPIVSKENVKLSNTFASNRGKLPYPISGIYSIIGRFGRQYHKQWKVTTTSNGIDIQSQQGAIAKAVFDGEVSTIAAFPGYNNGVIIRHGGYYTFYGNIQTVSVKKGDKVKTGQNIGMVYTDADTNLSLIHFQIWKGMTKLNPEPWLR